MANLKNHSTFVVQTGETVNSIRYDTLQEQMAPLAVQENATLQLAGTPGLMFPGKTLTYDRITGQLDVAENFVREYKGEIGYGPGQTPNMLDVGEEAGRYYIVADFTYKYMQNDWGTIGSNFDQQTRVYIGDVVEKKSDGSGDWRIIPQQIGNQHIHNDFTKYVWIGDVTRSGVVAADSMAAGAPDTIIQTQGYW